MQEADETAGNPAVPGKAVSVVRALAVLTVIFGALILYIPLDTFRFFGNLFEIAVATGCMAACLYAYRNWSGRITLLLAAFAFGGYALSNTFWYLYSEAIGREYVFFTVSELGFLGFMLFFVVVFRTGFPVRPAPPLLPGRTCRADPVTRPSRHRGAAPVLEYRASPVLVPCRYPPRRHRTGPWHIPAIISLDGDQPVEFCFDSLRSTGDPVHCAGRGSNHSPPRGTGPEPL